MGAGTTVRNEQAIEPANHFRFRSAGHALESDVVERAVEAKRRGNRLRFAVMLLFFRKRNWL